MIIEYKIKILSIYFPFELTFYCTINNLLVKIIIHKQLVTYTDYDITSGETTIKFRRRILRDRLYQQANKYI